MLAGLYHLAGPPADQRPLAYYGAGCVGCHVRSALNLDGPATAALSKGVHPIHLRGVAGSRGPGAKDFPLSSAGCRGCHTTAHAAWSNSAHGRAFTNRIFQHAFERDRKAWCLNCHAPLWDPERDGSPEVIAEHALSAAVANADYAEGVSCVACHVRDGEIWSATDYSQSDVELFHPVRHDPGLANDEFCAGCHQFNFVHELEPFTVYEGDEFPMQNVVREAAMTNGDLYTDGCVGCHYTDGDHSLKSEALPALRDKLRIRLTQPDARSVRLDLRMPRLGHHFPTGDLFRILSYYIYDARGELLYRYDFRKEVRVIDRAVISDTALKPRPGEPGASRTIAATGLKRAPARCLLVYRLQGAIDPEIEADFTDPGILRETIYDGDCVSDAE